MCDNKIFKSLLKIITPFSWMFCDFESSLNNINNDFNYFLNDIVVYNLLDKSHQIINIKKY